MFFFLCFLFIARLFCDLLLFSFDSATFSKFIHAVLEFFHSFFFVPSFCLSFSICLFACFLLLFQANTFSNSIKTSSANWKLEISSVSSHHSAVVGWTQENIGWDNGVIFLATSSESKSNEGCPLTDNCHVIKNAQGLLKNTQKMNK